MQDNLFTHLYVFSHGIRARVRKTPRVSFVIGCASFQPSYFFSTLAAALFPAICASTTTPIPKLTTSVDSSRRRLPSAGKSSPSDQSRAHTRGLNSTRAVCPVGAWRRVESPANLRLPSVDSSQPAGPSSGVILVVSQSVCGVISNWSRSVSFLTEFPYNHLIACGFLPVWCYIGSLLVLSIFFGPIFKWRLNLTPQRIYLCLLFRLLPQFVRRN